MRGWKKVVIFNKEAKTVGYVVTVILLNVIYLRNNGRKNELINSIYHGPWRRR